MPSPSHSVERPTGAALGLEIPRTNFGAPPGPTAKGCTYLVRGNGDTATQTVPHFKVRKTSLVKHTEHSNGVAKNLPFPHKTKAFELQRHTSLKLLTFRHRFSRAWFFGQTNKTRRPVNIMKLNGFFYVFDCCERGIHK